MAQITGAQIVLVAQIGAQLVPIIATTIVTLKSILAEQDVDPAVFARIEAAYADRIAQAEREAETHGHPVDPGGGFGA
jgi:hypothetical protein